MYQKFSYFSRLQNKFAMFSKYLQVILALLIHFTFVRLNISLIYPMKNGLSVNEIIKAVPIVTHSTTF